MALVNDKLKRLSKYEGYYKLNKSKKFRNCGIQVYVKEPEATKAPSTIQYFDQTS